MATALENANVLLDKTLSAFIAQTGGDMDAETSVELASAFALASIAGSLEAMATIQQQRWDFDYERQRQQ